MKKLISFAVIVMMVFSISAAGFAMETMKRGSRGDDVRELQEKLISLGYLDGNADGIYGPKTESAVLAFQ